jgi:hypothetical protein
VVMARTCDDMRPSRAYTGESGTGSGSQARRRSEAVAATSSPAAGESGAVRHKPIHPTVCKPYALTQGMLQ